MVRREREEEVECKRVRGEVKGLAKFRGELVRQRVGVPLVGMCLLARVKGEEHAVGNEWESVVVWEDVHRCERGDHVLLDGQLWVGKQR